ncbi:MAG: hypothetical protein M3Q85_01715, partial [Acidobacteriota bacterium]|nr:hypothetical protein [Acidobacteriota bacterium]
MFIRGALPAALVCTVLLAITAAAQPEMDRGALNRARALLRQSPLIDGHNDYPWAVREKAGRDLARLDISAPQ